MISFQNNTVTLEHQVHSLEQLHTLQVGILHLLSNQESIREYHDFQEWFRAVCRLLEGTLLTPDQLAICEKALTAEAQTEQHKTEASKSVKPAA